MSYLASLDQHQRERYDELVRLAQTTRFDGDLPADSPGGENDDDGTIVESAAKLEHAVVGHRIVAIEPARPRARDWCGVDESIALILDNGVRVRMIGQSDCCAYTGVGVYALLNTEHVVTDVRTTGGYSNWFILAAGLPVAALSVGWSCGNPFYYVYGFDIQVEVDGEVVSMELPPGDGREGDSVPAWQPTPGVHGIPAPKELE